MKIKNLPIIKLNLLLLFLITFTPSIFSQKKNINTLYSNYFENTRETPYLHLNKTTFIKGEEIWFKAYVIEQNSNKLHPTTSNLYVSIFDKKGVLKDQQLVHIKGGIGNGNILLDSTYTQEKYYLKASTNWMRNFNEDNSYTQSINIISATSTEKSTSISEKEYFEFKLFPEGGHLLADITNNVGILIKDIKNKGVKVNYGVIKNKNNEIVGNFKTNRFGLGKTSILFNKNDTYTFEAELPNGVKITEKTPSVNKKGIVLQTFETEELIKISLLTNNHSLEILNKKKYRFFIHNTRSFKNFYFNFDKDNTTYDLILKKEELSKGINIITLFNEKDIPVLEKIIFNDSEDLYNTIQIDKKNASKDSITLKISNTSNEEIYLSASSLPSTSKAYEPKNNIKSSVLLKPYVNGFIEDPTYYFNQKNKNRLEDLKLLFLTQGWSKFNWNNIFNSPQKTSFPFENGITISISLPKKLKKKQSILIHSGENNLISKLEPNENPYTLKNTFIKKNSIINFSLYNNNRQFPVSPTLSYSKTSLVENFNLKVREDNKKIELQISDFTSISKDVEVLDEVIITSKKSKIVNKPYGAETMLRSFKMENVIGKSSTTVIDFLKLKGFGAKNLAGELYLTPRGEIMQFSFNQDQDSINKTDPVVNPLKGLGVGVYLDDAKITHSQWMIESIYLDRIKQITYGRDPGGRENEVIYIYTLSPSEYNSKEVEFYKLETPVGFATNKEFYSPKYPSLLNNTYTFYGALFWNPNLTLKPHSQLTFKLPINLTESLKVFVEGISETGKLISIEQEIRTN